MSPSWICFSLCILRKIKMCCKLTQESSDPGIQGFAHLIGPSNILGFRLFGVWGLGFRVPGSPFEGSGFLAVCSQT